MLNRVILQGRLTETPELKHTPNGNAVTVFAIAVEDSRSSGDERKVNFFKIEAWKGTAEFICKYFDKGQQIIVEGRLTVKSYVGKDDVKRKDVYIVADGINFCGAKSSEAHEKEVEEAFESYDEPESLF